NPGTYTVRHRSTSAAPATGPPNRRRPGGRQRRKGAGVSAAGSMRSGFLQRERDYNRALPRAVRAVRLPVAAGASAWQRVWAWTSAPARAWWARWLLLGAIGVLVLLPLDGVIRTSAGWLGGRLGGDLRRELEVIQQYGAITSLLLIA